jgi:hypothetical protein
MGRPVGSANRQKPFADKLRSALLSGGVAALLLASFLGVVSAKVDCNAVPAGSARTDCYIGLARVYQGKSDVAPGNARVQSDAARLQQVTGTRSRPNASKHRRKKAAPVGPE